MSLTEPQPVRLVSFTSVTAECASTYTAESALARLCAIEVVRLCFTCVTALYSRVLPDQAGRYGGS
jgi:hypothetical protein